MRSRGPVVLLTVVAAAVPAPAALAADPPVVALRPAERGVELVRLKPRTLSAAARPIRLRDAEPQGLAVAPDGRRVAVVTRTSGLRERTRVTIVSKRSWRRSATLRLRGGDGSVVAVEWLRADRVLTFQRSVAGGGPLRVTVIDPLAGTVVARTTVPEGFGSPRAAGDRIATFALAPGGASNQVLVLDADGNEAGRVEAGDLSDPAAGRPSASATVDPATGHVLLLGARTPAIVDVDPVALTATRHDFPAPGEAGAAQTWIEGAADATRLAFAVPADDAGRSRVVPVDRATLTPGPAVTTTGFNPLEGAGDLVLVPSSSLSSRSLKGLRAYSLAGEQRWTAERGHRTTAGHRFGDVVYADVQGVGSTILDARTGKTLRRGPRRPLQIFERTPAFEAQQPWFGFGGD